MVDEIDGNRVMGKGLISLVLLLVIVIIIVLLL